MRNWNHCNIYIFILSILSFYSTYEELKHQTHLVVRSLVFSFYSTYEELKLIRLNFQTWIFFLFLQYLWGIETCFSLWKATACCWVFTVPMRNWNKVSALESGCFPICFYSTYEELKHETESGKNAKLLVFLQYLWGIETGVAEVVSAFAKLVFTVPMRNWNAIVAAYKGRWRHGFYSTYEELKRFWLLSAWSAFFLFLQYLWGIETCLHHFQSVL